MQVKLIKSSITYTTKTSPAPALLPMFCDLCSVVANVISPQLQEYLVNVCAFRQLVLRYDIPRLTIWRRKRNQVSAMPKMLVWEKLYRSLYTRYLIIAIIVVMFVVVGTSR